MHRSTILTSSLVVAVTLAIGALIGWAFSGSDETDMVPTGATPSVVADEAARHLLAPQFVGTADPTKDPTGDAIADVGRLEAGVVTVEPQRIVPLLEPVRLDDPDVTDPSRLDSWDVGAPVASDEVNSDGRVTKAAGFTAGGVAGMTPVPGFDETSAQVESAADTVEIVEIIEGSETVEESDIVEDPDRDVDTAADSDTGDSGVGEGESAADSGLIELSPFVEEASEPDDPEMAGAAVPFVVMPDVGVLLEIPPITFDPCAGPLPGGASCDGGIAGTIFALSTPPPLEVSVTPGIATTPRVPGGVVCPADTPEPADGETSFTIWSTAPLAAADVDIRPVGSAITPVELTVSTAASVRAEWDRRFEAAGEYDRSWGLVPTCVVARVDVLGTQEVSGVVADSFDRIASIPATPVAAGVGDRPPTETRIDGVSPTAHVRAWTTAEGSVAFRVRQLGNRIGGDDDLDCATAPAVPDRRVYPSNGPVPDVYDPDFSRSYFTQIPFQTGGRLLVCVEIYDTANPLIPLVVERHLFEAPMQPRPEVYLASIDTRDDGDAIDELFWRTGGGAGGAASPGCDRFFSTPSVDDDVLAVLNQPLWECLGPQTSLTPTGTFNLALQAQRGDSTIIDVAVPIDAKDCRVDRCPQRTEYFRIPIVAPGELVCWRGINEVCPGEPDIDAVALIAVKYPLRAGLGGLDGRVTPLDEVDLDVLAGEPRVTVPTMSVRSGDGFARWDATFRFQTDRPVRGAIEPFELPSGTSCYESERSPFTAEPASEFALDASGLCGNRSYAVYVHLLDEDGNEWRIDPGSGYATPRSPAADFRVQLDFVADSSRELFIEPGDRAILRGPQFPGRQVRLPTSASIAETCFSTSDAYYTVDRVRLGSDVTDLAVRVDLPVREVSEGFDGCRMIEAEWEHYVRCNELPRSSEEYELACVDPPGSAPPPPRIRAQNWTFFGVVSVELLERGVPVVVTSSSNDSGITMRFTIERTSDWID